MRVRYPAIHRSSRKMCIPHPWNRERSAAGTAACKTRKMTATSVGALHHLELWVPSFTRAESEWGWLLSRLGYETYQEWPNGRSWRRGQTYIVLEESPDLSSRVHERTFPGLNHLAFRAGTEAQVDALAQEASANGWDSLFQDKYPHAGGPGHYAAYLTNSHGFEVELIATE